MDDENVENVIRGAAIEAWEAAVADPNLPLFSRLRCLERQLRSLGLDDAAELVRDTRGTMAFAVSRAAMIVSAAKAAAPGDMAMAMIIADSRDLGTCLTEGIHRLGDGEIAR
jgi:hypothetical protein